MIHRGNWFWWLVGAAVFVAIVPVLAAILGGIAVAVIYLISLRIHPFMTCRSCGGSGRRSGKVFGYTHRQCLSCGGQGRHRRLGTTVFHRGAPSGLSGRQQERGMAGEPGRCPNWRLPLRYWQWFPKVLAGKIRPIPANSMCPSGRCTLPS